MSGPLPETGPESSTRIPAGACELSTRQWQALARMADRYAAFEDVAGGPLGDVATKTAERASSLLRDHDLPRLAHEILEAAEALSSAGVFAAIGEGARPAKEALGRTLDAEGMAKAGAAILELHDQWQAVRRLTARLETIEAWFEGPAAGALAQAFTRLLDATRDTDVARLGHDLLKLLGTLSRTGALSRLADEVPYVIDTVARLARMAPSWLDAAGPALAKARADLAFAHALADTGRAVGDLGKGPAGEALARAAAELSLWASGHDVAGLTQEVVALLASWRRADVFPAAREAGLALAGLAASWERAQAAAGGDGQAMQGLFLGISRTLDRMQRVRADFARGQDESPGGLKGLYRLLMDARVQDGLRQGAALLQALSGATPDARAEAAGDGGHGGDGARP